ncbi:MAG: phage tail assembly chaperone [Paracoccaceae bacterium]
MKVAWPKLMRLGLVQLGLAPQVFWALTPAELMLLTGAEDANGALSRAGFAELSALFPD